MGQISLGSMGPRWHLVDSQWESVGGTLVLEKAWYRMQSGNVVVGAAVCTRLCLSALHCARARLQLAKKAS